MNEQELQDLKKLLIAERKMLFEGNMDDVDAIATQKEALMHKIQGNMHLKRMLASNFIDLKSDIARNLDLLLIAIQAIKKTHENYSQSNAKSSLVSYTADGSTLPLPSPYKTLLRKY